MDGRTTRTTLSFLELEPTPQPSSTCTVDRLQPQVAYTFPHQSVWENETSETPADDSGSGKKRGVRSFLLYVH